MYMAISGISIDEIAKPGLREKYHNYFKAEFQGMRMMDLTSNCYYAENTKSNLKFSCKGISRKQNSVSWERYLKALNTGY